MVCEAESRPCQAQFTGNLRRRKMMTKMQIRNSTVDFLVFTKDAGDNGIEVRVQDGDIWLT